MHCFCYFWYFFLGGYRFIRVGSHERRLGHPLNAEGGAGIIHVKFSHPFFNQQEVFLFPKKRSFLLGLVLGFSRYSVSRLVKKSLTKLYLLLR